MTIKVFTTPMCKWVYPSTKRKPVCLIGGIIEFTLLAISSVEKDQSPHCGSYHISRKKSQDNPYVTHKFPLRQCWNRTI